MSASRTTTMVWGVVVVFVAMLACIVALSFSVTDSEQLIRLIGIIIPAVASLAVLILALDKVGSVDDKVDKIAVQTTDLTNGLLDAKVRAAIADVIRPEHVDPAAHNQLTADRERVSRANTEIHNPHTP